VGTITPGVAGAPIYPTLTPCTISFPILEGSTSPQGPGPYSSQLAGNPYYSLHNLQPDGLTVDPIGCLFISKL
jgi:hypothetical protein